jgi:pyruvate dehydrogenase E1 component alpha subunit
MAGELVDGNDLFAMHDACSRAVARARAGEGPTLIEARTYRMGPHNTSDDPTRYVDPVELEERRAFDPIERVRRYLTAEGLIDEASEQRLVDELRADVDAAFAEAQASPAPGSDAIFDHVYAREPARLDAQRRSAAKEAG